MGDWHEYKCFDQTLYLKSYLIIIFFKYSKYISITSIEGKIEKNIINNKVYEMII
jgi:hypothetical protein